MLIVFSETDQLRFKHVFIHLYVYAAKLKLNPHFRGSEAEVNAPFN